VVPGPEVAAPATLAVVGADEWEPRVTGCVVSETDDRPVGEAVCVGVDAPANREPRAVVGVTRPGLRPPVVGVLTPGAVRAPVVAGVLPVVTPRSGGAVVGVAVLVRPVVADVRAVVAVVRAVVAVVRAVVAVVEWAVVAVACPAVVGVAAAVVLVAPATVVVTAAVVVVATVVVVVATVVVVVDATVVVVAGTASWKAAPHAVDWTIDGVTSPAAKLDDSVAVSAG
jgi:hypothetical protein